MCRCKQKADSNRFPRGESAARGGRFPLTMQEIGDLVVRMSPEQRNDLLRLIQAKQEEGRRG
jgi:hypothetical protein